MSHSNLAVASSAIGLARSLVDFVPASGALINISRDTYNWLIRERIDESSFLHCRQLAHGLAYPNDGGSDIHRQVQEADRKILERVKQVPVRLVLSGSVGRLLAKDVDTCYMVSTVAVLTKFHDPEFATDALCSMILDRGGHEKEVSLRYNVQRSPVKAVISKIVDSIYLNVINAGHDLGGLPAELGHLHWHLLDDLTFAGIVMGIERSEQDVVIRSDRFLSDLTLWLLLHFHGTIVVSVSKAVLFEKTLGPSSRFVRMMVKELCPEDVKTCLKADAPVEALISVGDELFTFLTGTDDNDFHPCSYTRQAFYDVEDLTSSPRSAKLKLLDRAECNSIARVAKGMMDWLLNVPVVPAPDLLGLTFRVLLDSEVKSGMSIGDLLQKHPGLPNLNTGLLPTQRAVIRRPDEGLSDELSDDEALPDTSPSNPSSIFAWFPLAQSLLDDIQPRCSCSACKSGANLDLCKRGCLREATVTRLFVLLAHGICDAFGAKDVSGRANPEDQVTGMTTLLLEILHQQLVRWDTWFELVACTTAGMSWDAFDSVGDDGCSSWAAVQYGSFLAVAPWLDLAKEAKVKGCFGIMTVEGSLQGVPDDAGLVRCEMDQYNETYQPLGTSLGTESSANEPHRMQIETADRASDIIDAAIRLDTLKVERYTAIFRSDRFLYRLMTTVRSDRNVRIVDPSQVIMGLARCHSIQCQHDPTSAVMSSADVIRVDDFDLILADWSSSPTSSNMIQMSQGMDSQLKINTLLSIVRKGSVLRDMKSCCINCAIEKSRDLQNGDRRCIINTSANSSALVQSRTRKRPVEL